MSIPPSLFLCLSLSYLSFPPCLSLSITMCSQRKLHVSTWQKGNSLSATQKENSHQKLNLPVPWSGTSSLQYHEKINFYCLRHPVCGILLWQPRLANTDTNSTMEPKKVGNQEEVGKEIGVLNKKMNTKRKTETSEKTEGGKCHCSRLLNFT